MQLQKLIPILILALLTNHTYSQNAIHNISLDSSTYDIKLSIKDQKYNLSLAGGSAINSSKTISELPFRVFKNIIIREHLRQIIEEGQKSRSISELRQDTSINTKIKNAYIELMSTLNEDSEDGQHIATATLLQNVNVYSSDLVTGEGRQHRRPQKDGQEIKSRGQTFKIQSRKRTRSINWLRSKKAKTGKKGEKKNSEKKRFKTRQQKAIRMVESRIN